jgi:hypothetical protein
MALAILLGFALGPPVLVLRRCHFGRVPSVIVVVVLAFLMIVGIGVFVGNQLARLAGELPGYQTNITQKIHSLRNTTTRGGVVDRTSAMLSNLNKEIEKPEEKGAGTVANEPAALSRNGPSAEAARHCRGCGHPRPMHPASWPSKLPPVFNRPRLEFSYTGRKATRLGYRLSGTVER